MDKIAAVQSFFTGGIKAVIRYTFWKIPSFLEKFFVLTGRKKACFVSMSAKPHFSCKFVQRNSSRMQSLNNLS